MTRRGPLVFLLLAFGLAWGPWLWELRQGWRPGDAAVPASVYLAAWAPALAAAAARLLAEGGSFADSGLDVHASRWPNYLAAWLWPLAATVLILGLAQALGLAAVDWTMARGAEFLAARGGMAAPPARTESLWFMGLLEAVPSAPLFFGEEFGWRAYLQRRILPGRPLAAAAAVGVIWSVWHLPLNLHGYTFPASPLAGLAVYTVSCVLLSVLLGWLMAATGSVWCVSLAHAAANTAGSTMTLLGTGGQQGLIVQFLGVLGWVPMLLTIGWLAWNGRLLTPMEPTA